MRSTCDGLLVVLISVCGVGCTETKPAVTPAPVVRIVDAGPTIVELGEAKASWRDPALKEVVDFQIPYKFTSGAPQKFYQCRVTFPDDKAAGVKTMESWELKQEGVIKTGIPAGGKVVKAFEINFFEADAPDKAFKPVSNTVKGEVPAPLMSEEVKAST